MFEGLFGKKEPEGGFTNKKPVYTGENVVDPVTSEMVTQEELKERTAIRAESNREQL